MEVIAISMASYKGNVWLVLSTGEQPANAKWALEVKAPFNARFLKLAWYERIDDCTADASAWVEHHCHVRITSLE